MTVTHDLALLLQAVLADPDDDAVRLAYADLLEEDGRRQAAELIRVQCEMARPDPCGLPAKCIWGPAEPPFGLTQSKPFCGKMECMVRSRLRVRERALLGWAGDWFVP